MGKKKFKLHTFYNREEGTFTAQSSVCVTQVTSTGTLNHSNRADKRLPGTRDLYGGATVRILGVEFWPAALGHSERAPAALSEPRARGSRAGVGAVVPSPARSGYGLPVPALPRPLRPTGTSLPAASAGPPAPPAVRSAGGR